MTTPASAHAPRHPVALANRILLVLLLVLATLAAPQTTGTARADDPTDPPASISVGDAKTDGLKAQITDYNQSVAAQQAAEQTLVTDKTSIESQVASVNEALNADDAAGAETDREFAELNGAIQAYNDAGPPGDPSYAAELDAEGKQLAAQQDQNNAKVRADNAEHARVAAALDAHNKKVADYKSTNQKLAAERATLMEQILAEQAAADLAVITTLATVDSLNGMDSPKQDQVEVTNGGDSAAPATRHSCGHSFAAGTEVLTAAGTAEPIQDVRVGDLIENAQSGGGNEIHRVDQVHVTTTDTDFTRLTVGTPAGPETVTGTQNHPYYDQTVGAFVNAEDLKPGDRLQSSNANTHVTVLSAENFTGHMVTYDLTISGLHTYYVLAGSAAVLVHNSDCSPLIGDAASIVNSLDSHTLFHYTNEDGINAAVRGDGVVLRANQSGKVFATRELQSPAEAEQNLYIGNPAYAGKGDYVIVFRSPEGADFAAGEQPNELINQGTVRIPMSDVIYAGPNPFE